MKYWIQDQLGKHHIFEAKDDKEAGDYFWNSGDRAYDWGRADKQYFIERLKGEHYDNITRAD
jgi:hypothetical protein